jgi:hypothetical protein
MYSFEDCAKMISSVSNSCNILTFIFFTLFFYENILSKSIIFPLFGSTVMITLMIHSYLKNSISIYRFYLLYSIVYYMILSTFVYMANVATENVNMFNIFILMNFPTFINTMAFITSNPSKTQ